MSTIKNHVQLIGNVGQEPTITNLESGKKVARLSLATNEYYKNGTPLSLGAKLLKLSKSMPKRAKKSELLEN